MWTLAPSLVVSTQKGWGELRSLATGQRWDLGPEDLAIIRALAAGIPDAEADKHRELEAAAELGWAARADSLVDPQTRQRLEALERHFAWCKCAYDPNAHAAVLDAHAARRHLHRGFAQHQALPETIARRAALAGSEPKNVLVLGDDDFVSVALARLGHRVTVLEIDTAITDHIRRSAPDVEVIVHDLREPLPARLVQAFDAFFADPVSGAGAFRLFLARGLTALGSDGRGFVCVSEAGALNFMAVAAELGGEVTGQLTDFNHYHAPDYSLAFYTSDLATVRVKDAASISPRPDEPYLPRGITFEDRFLETPASRYVFKSINPATSEIIHLDQMLKLLERTGRLSIRNRSYYEENGVRTYHVHTKEGGAVFLRILIEEKIGELFVAPADAMLENALITVLLGALGIDGTVVEKRRVRGSAVYGVT